MNLQGRAMLEALNLSKSFGALHVTNNITFKIAKGERRAIIGPNGAGKTTLFNLLSGELKADSGRVILAGNDVTRLKPDARARRGLGRSFQKNNLFDGLSVHHSLCLAAITALNKSKIFWRDPAADEDVIERVETTAGLIKLEDVLDTNTDTLSYGQRRQLEIGIALASRPQVLLLDEPTSGMSPEETGTMLALLQNLGRDVTMLIIEHDMDLVFSLADQVSVLNYGELVFEGSPQEARNSDEVRRIYIGEWGQ